MNDYKRLCEEFVDDRLALAVCVAIQPGSTPCLAPCWACRVSAAAVVRELAEQAESHVDQLSALAAELEGISDRANTDRAALAEPVVAPYGKTAEQARRDRAGEAGKAAADASIEAVLAAQPAPPTPPAGGLVERVAAAMHPCYPRAFQGEAHAAIREVAAWLDLVGNKGSADELRREADR